MITKTVFLLVFAYFKLSVASNKNSCADVRRAFVTQKIGPLKIVPYQPLSDQKLRICNNAGVTCCNPAMESKYKVAVNGDLVELIQRRTSSVKFNINSFTERFEADVSFLSTKAKVVSLRTLKPLLLRRQNRRRSTRIDEAVNKLYANIDLNTSDTDLQTAFKWFEDTIFNVMYASTSRPDDVTLRSLYEECTAIQRRVINPFDNIPSEAYKNISVALKLSLEFKKALEVGKMVVNLTESYKLSKNCQKGLTKMMFCSHCYGLTLIRPCANLCHNVIRGCLAGLSEVGMHWPFYVENLIGLSKQMRSTDPSKNLDIAFMEFNRQFGASITSLKSRKSSIRKQVSKECNKYLENTRTKRSSSKRSRMPSPDDLLDASLETESLVHPPSHEVPYLQNEDLRKTKQQVKNRRTASRTSERSRKHVLPPHEMLKIAQIDRSNRQQNTEAIESLLERIENKPETNLHTRLERFTELFNETRSLYRELPDDLCDSSHESSISVISGDVCWDGTDIVEKYKKPVVDIGLQQQESNPEVKVKHIDDQTIEVIKELRRKTKHMMEILGNDVVPSILKSEPSYLVKKEQEKKHKEEKSAIVCDDEDDCDGDNGSGVGAMKNEDTVAEDATKSPKSTTSYDVLSTTKDQSKESRKKTKEHEEHVKKKHTTSTQTILSTTTPKNNNTSLSRRRSKGDPPTGGNSAATVFSISKVYQFLISFIVLYYFNVNTFSA